MTTLPPLTPYVVGALPPPRPYVWVNEMVAAVTRPQAEAAAVRARLEALEHKVAELTDLLRASRPCSCVLEEGGQSNGRGMDFGALEAFKPGSNGAATATTASQPQPRLAGAKEG
jgi:hypothetical protein